MEEKTKKCVCREELCIGGAEVEIGGVCHRPNNPCYIIENQTNNRIREEWREELAEIIFQIQRCPKQYRTCLNCKEALENNIAELLKSQREELLEKIEEKFKEYQNDSEILAKNCIFRTGMGKEDIINLIKEDK